MGCGGLPNRRLTGGRGLPRKPHHFRSPPSGYHLAGVFRKVQEPRDNIAAVLVELADNLERLSSLVRGPTPVPLSAPGVDGEWSAAEILAHLRACADVWGKSIASMIRDDHRTIRYVSPRTWIRKTNYNDLDFTTLLVAFSGQRTGLLTSLRELPPEVWSREATFTARTRGSSATVLDYAQNLASHEFQHLKQMEAVLRRS